MDVRVRELELQALHVWHASMVMLVRPGESAGVSVFEASALAGPGESADDGSRFPYHLLVIEVDDPWDIPTQMRLRASLKACIADR